MLLTMLCYSAARMAKKGEKKASRVNDIVTREYTINMHKRLMGQ